jgi:hypothetical protein
LRIRSTIIRFSARSFKLADSSADRADEAFGGIGHHRPVAQAQIGGEGGGAVADQPGQQVEGPRARRQAAGPGPGDVGLEDLARADPRDDVGHRRLVGGAVRCGEGPGQPAGGRRDGGFVQPACGGGGARLGRGRGPAAPHRPHPAIPVVEGQQRLVAGAGEVRPAGLARQPQRLDPVPQLIGRQACDAALERRAVVQPRARVAAKAAQGVERIDGVAGLDGERRGRPAGDIRPAGPGAFAA